MKVYLSNYRNHWISPYDILKKVCFWEKDEDKFYNFENDPKNKYQKLVNFLEPFCTGLMKFLDFVHPQISYIKIDKYDTWSMDTTLSPIIHKMLVQLKETTHGAPDVKDEDVPKELRSTSAPPKENEFDVDANHFKRWNYILDEMIWSFAQMSDFDNDRKFYGDSINDFDAEGFKKHHDRIDNGVRLFGKYYRGLWD